MYGKTIQKIRKSKNMTLKEAASGALSVSQLSRFENEKSMIPVDLFYMILNNLNTTTEEFNYIMHLNQEDPNTPLLKRIEKYSFHKEYDKLEDLIDEIKEQNPSPYSWDQFIIYFIESVISLDKDHKEKVNPAVLDYLMQVEVWGEMELRLYVFFGFTLGVETTYFLMRTALKRSKQYLSVPSTAKLLYHILTNNFSTFLAFDKIEYARETIALFETTYAKETKFLSPHINHLFNKGLLAFKENKPELGQKHCENAIQICRDFQLFEDEKRYQERFENWRESYNDPDFKEIIISIEF